MHTPCNADELSGKSHNRHFPLKPDMGFDFRLAPLVVLSPYRLPKGPVDIYFQSLLADWLRLHSTTQQTFPFGVAVPVPYN